MKIPDTFADTFAATICKVCGLCLVENDLEETDPSHCFLFYNSDKQTFMKIIEYLMKMKKVDVVRYMDYLAFEGFCGLFCRSGDNCPYTSVQCDDIVQVVDCYKSFVAQAGIAITLPMEVELAAKYAEVNTSEIGAEFRIKNVKLDKKEKKSVTRTLHRALKAFLKRKKNKFTARQPVVERKERKVKKKVSTYFFFRDDDPVWANKVRKILGMEEKAVGKT